jgi:crotonobetainyl-CoA:carnitine CoA-transferase CaiB-like acyl-CoA transferase
MDQALQGLKVADFSWAAVGPLITKYLGDHGATVVRVESSTSPDIMRSNAPFKDNQPGINRSAYYAVINPNKHSLALDLNHPEGPGVAKRLVAWADVVVENFTAGTMEKWGLGYNELCKVKPDIIMVRSCNQGQTGPHARHPGLGFMLVGLTGFLSFTGWPDRNPAPLPVAYTDLIAPRFGMAALMAALDHRRRTGQGQCIDISQLETGLHFIAPPLLDYVVNGRQGGSNGNADPYAAPHGAYRCRGDDRWCVIAVFTDEEWGAFCRVLGNPEWTAGARFATLEARKGNESELNVLVEQWTVDHTPEEVMGKMQAAGVPAGVVQSGKAVCEDPQLNHRGYFWSLEHPEIGPTTYLGEPFLLSGTPAQGNMPSPCLGEHTEHVCREFLHIPDDEFIRLLGDGVLQ